MKTETNIKPKVKLAGTDGNVFALLGKCNEALRKAGLRDKAKELSDEVFKCKSYEEALSTMGKYLDIH